VTGPWTARTRIDAALSGVNIKRGVVLSKSCGVGERRRATSISSYPLHCPPVHVYDTKKACFRWLTRRWHSIIIKSGRHVPVSRRNMPCVGRPRRLLITARHDRSTDLNYSTDGLSPNKTGVQIVASPNFAHTPPFGALIEPVRW